MSILNLYENLVKAPTPTELEHAGHMAYLAYVTPAMSSIMEYAGRTCYKSFANMNADTYKKFISTIVKSGHESVIEHGSMVYVIFKQNGNKKGKDCVDINRELITVMMYNRLITISETSAFYVLSGNPRMFKDLIRKYFEIKSLNNKFNKILEDIRQSFYTLPSYWFEDMIADYPQYINRDEFKIDTRYKESCSSFKLHKLNDYVSILNHDTFSLKIKGFVVNTDKGTSVNRVSMPISILKKHNTITLEITAPRYITHQIVRQRLCSYSQNSQRYVDQANCETYIPETIRDKKLEVIANQAYNIALSSYETLKKEGIPKEDARCVLPNAVMSTIVMTATVEEFEWICKLRGAKGAQNFYRDYIAIPLKEYLDKYYTSMDSDFRTRTPAESNSDASASYRNKLAKRETIKNAGKPSKRNMGNKKTPNPNAKLHDQKPVQGQQQKRNNKPQVKKRSNNPKVKK